MTDGHMSDVIAHQIAVALDDDIAQMNPDPELGAPMRLSGATLLLRAVMPC
jgi:hypothetical protein